MTKTRTSGPQLNRIKKNFTTRDPLGIEGVAATISGEICPIVNTVTPRAFYWLFMVWLYYDFYTNSGISKRDYDSFNNFVKRQDYFFVVANLLAESKDQNNLVGKRQAEQDILRNKSGKYRYNKNYFKSRFGGMQYYNAGCISLHYVLDRNFETEETYSFPKMHKSGEELALAFEHVIKDTKYYKKYRLSNEDVPESVLLEYGKTVSLSLKGFTKCKRLLKSRLFETMENEKLRECADYLLFLRDRYHIQDFGTANMRYVLYDYFSPRGENRGFKKQLGTIIRQWEIVVGRQYFTMGLEMIFSYLLSQLDAPMTLEDWMSSAISNSEIDFDLESRISTLLRQCVYNYDDREEMIVSSRNGKGYDNSIADGLRLILSVYNRFYERDDFGEEEKYLYYDAGGNSISIAKMIDVINEYKSEKVVELLQYIFKNWIVDQHYMTAFEKLLQNRDGFYFEVIDERYKFKNDHSLRFQGIRLTQLAQVMRDLNAL